MYLELQDPLSPVSADVPLDQDLGLGSPCWGCRWYLILSDFETYEQTPSQINVKTNICIIEEKQRAFIKKTSKNPVIFPITFIKKIEMTFI